ncbi:4-hydroxy-2-oxoheptanedioate aldolase [Pseudorhizobium tarimense]|uniref:4-hydroxy-2-oxoheptanedioate aldolase n=1 Tax=Pseudorhizobium tarimense TaxID=1079109 RepID=A0ABV2HDF2_9HYPH|nr:aldolase/citrate lyase family protein [Pseudorhizobium tarimense]MCJ8521497.1 aldolase/citrate lyase family protein [Pseudorhizobium tarimense]
MSSQSRLNGLIAKLEAGDVAYSLFAPTSIEVAVELQVSSYDGVVFEGEHRGWDINGLRDSLQYLLNRQQILRQGTPAPAITPLARIPANGAERNQFLAKQALDIGCYGVVWPHVSTVREAYNAVAACRYPRLKDRALHQPAGLRGDGPMAAASYWGISQQEYYRRSDVWPLDREGEILTILQIEDTAGIDNLPEILRNVPGIGVILVGEGDLSQELGHPREAEHPAVLEAIDAIARICKEHGVVAGHPHASAGNAARLVEQGFRFLMCAAPRNFGPLKALKETVSSVVP